MALQVSNNMWAVTFPFKPPFTAYFTDSQFEAVFVPLEESPLIAEAGLLIPDRIPDVVLNFPFTPSSSVRPNANTGHNALVGKRYRAEKAKLRKQAAQVVIDLMNQHRHPPTYGSDTLLVVDVYWEKTPTPRYPNGRYRQFVDAHDALPGMCKGIIDGIVDAKLLEDDRHLKVAYHQHKAPDGNGYVSVRMWGRRVDPHAPVPADQ